MCQCFLYAKTFKMRKFFRRVFVILVLLVIIFFIFRIVKPEATSKFVDKVKAIPQTISGRFHRSSELDIIVDSETNSISWDISDTISDDLDADEWDAELIIENTWEMTVSWDEENISDISDLEWLEQLNNEIESILSGNTWDSTNSNMIDVEFHEYESKDDVVINTWKDENISWNSVAESQWGINFNQNQDTVQNTKPVKVNTICCDEDCVLSDEECLLMQRELGNLN